MRYIEEGLHAEVIDKQSNTGQQSKHKEINVLGLSGSLHVHLTPAVGQEHLSVSPAEMGGRIVRQLISAE